MMGRRAFLAAGAAAVCGVAAGDAPPAGDATVGTVRLATGERAGSYAPFARLLVRELRAAAPGLRCTTIPTEGSLDNLHLVATGRADLALSLADIAEAAFLGTAPFGRSTRLYALGRIFENYLQLAVRADSEIRTLPQLAGGAVSVGAAGSGGAVLGTRLLEGAGVRGVRMLRLPMPEAQAAMLSGAIDAMLVSGGVPITVLAELDADIGIRLLPLAEYRSVLGPPGQTVYEPVPVPPGAYHGGSDVDTVGVANLLVCAPLLPTPVAALVSDVLADRAGALIPAQAVGTQFLDVRSLINTGTVPLHPGAIGAYRRRHG